MKVYVSGPITGYPELNRPAFAVAAEFLRAGGHEPVNPHDVSPTDGDCPVKHDHVGSGTCTWEAYLKADLRVMLECEAVALLPGWQKSRGAQLEVDVARRVKMEVKPLRYWM